MKGLAITNCELIRTVHNSFSRTEAFVVDDKSLKGKSEDVYHFISYVPVAGVLFELDGLKRGPISHGECTREDWLDKVCPIIQKRIERYSNSEIRFNLLAIIKNKKNTYLQQLQALQEKRQSIMQTDEAQTEEELLTIRQQIETLEKKIAAEESKFNQWKIENIRRKHNYIPFLVNLLKILAEKGELLPLIEKARAKNNQ